MASNAPTTTPTMIASFDEDLVAAPSVGVEVGSEIDDDDDDNDEDEDDKEEEGEEEGDAGGVGVDPVKPLFEEVVLGTEIFPTGDFDAEFVVSAPVAVLDFEEVIPSAGDPVLSPEPLLAVAEVLEVLEVEEV